MPELTADGLGSILRNRSSLKGKVIFPRDTAYDSFLSSFFSAQAAAIRPICVVRPEHTSEVADAVSALSELRSRGHDVKVGIKSGGHTPFGAANVHGGVVIDMEAFSQVRVSEDGKSACVGTGCRWGDAYQKLEEHGLAIPGGRASHVGVGGLTLGGQCQVIPSANDSSNLSKGGLSFFSPQSGFVCDSVISFEVVLASGEVVHASKDSHHDLWLALKGGSNNFGIVTYFTMKTFPLGKMWGGSIYYSADERDRHLAALSRFACAGSAYDPKATVIQSHGFKAGMGRAILNAVEYTEPVENPPCLQPFTEIPPRMNTTRFAPLSEMAYEIAKHAPAGRQQFHLTTTVGCDEMFLRWCLDQWGESLKSVEAVAGVVWSLVFQPLPPVITQASARTGGNSLGLADNDRKLLVVQLVTSWDDAADQPTIVKCGRHLMGQIDEEARLRSLGHRFEYLNYAWEDQEPIAGYGAESLAFLRAVSKKYDPSGFFQQAVHQGFKLF